MKTINKLLGLAIIITFMSACSSTKITYDKNVDFSQYKTFAFFKKGIQNLHIPKDKKHFVLKTLSEAMLRKGFTKSSHPDLIVNIFTDIHKRIDVYSGYYPLWYRRDRIEKSKEGTIYLDIVDLKQKKVVWSGSRYINLQGNDYKALKHAIYKLLDKFPPKKK